MRIINEQEEPVRTSELPLAAALICLGFSIDHLESVENQRVYFVFLHSAELGKTVQSFWKGTIRVDPKKYFYSLKEIKSRIHAERQNY